MTPEEAGPPEAEWVRRAQAGDAAAWEALITAHRPAACRLAYLLLGDAAEADDAAQEACLRAYRALDRFELGRPFRPWLLRITVNLARNRQRSLGRYWAALQRRLRAEPAPVVDAHTLTAQQLEAQAVWRAVQRLAETDQQIIYLRYFLELSEAEAAAALDVPAGTVKSRLHRALGRLRIVITRDFPDLQPELVDG
ncbi:MAG: RNA polymerase sigma factor [Anaerolineales bacterium]|nr:RNA polymerase sigma factor [Anaerolineales bacterium]